MNRFIECVRHELEVAVRTRRVLVLAGVYIAAALFGSYMISRVLESAAEQFVEVTVGAEMTDEQRATVSEGLQAHASEMLDDVFEASGVPPDEVAPALRASPHAAIYFWCSLLFLPWLTLLTTFDGVSTILRDRTLCYSTLRASRSTLIGAKYVAQVGLILGIAGLANVAAFLLAWQTSEVVSLAGAVKSGLWCAFASSSFVMAYVGLAQFCSSTTTKPLSALVRGVLLMLLLRLFRLPAWGVELDVLPGDGPIGVIARVLRVFSPRTHVSGLWHNLDLALFTSIGAYALFAAAFVALSLRTVSRRDL